MTYLPLAGLLPFDYPADGSLVLGDVGKLMMNDGSDTAKVYSQIDQTAAKAVLTITAPAQAAVAVVQAHFRMFFHTQPAVNDPFGIHVDVEGSGSGTAVEGKFVSGSPGAGEVQIGATIADTITNLITYLNASTPVTQGYINVATNEPGEHSMTVTADVAKYSGTNGNAHTSSGQIQGLVATLDRSGGNYTWPHSTTAPFLNTSGAIELMDLVDNVLLGSDFLGPQNGANAIPASTIHLEDFVNGTILDLTAGVDWTPTGNPTAEAAAVLAAAAAALAGAGWTQSALVGVLTMLNATPGEDAVTASLGGTTSWASFVGTSGTDFSAIMTALGKLIDLTGGIAKIVPPHGQRFIASGAITRGDLLRGAGGGKLATSLVDGDYIVGYASTSAADGAEIIPNYSVPTPGNWANQDGIKPRTIDQAIQNLSEHSLSNKGGFVQGGTITVDNQGADTPCFRANGNSNNNSSNIQEWSDQGVLASFVDPEGRINGVPAATFAFLDATSSIQNQLDSKASAAESAEQDLGSLTWSAGVAPSGTINKKYRWNQVGKKVDLWVKVDASVAGTAVLSVDFALPGDMPAPSIFGSQPASTIIAYGEGNLTTAANSAIAAAGDSKLYLDAGSAARVTVETAVALAGKFAWAHLTYLAA